MKVKRHCKSGHIMIRTIEGMRGIDTYKIWKCTGIINKKIKGIIQKDKNGNKIKINCPHRKSWHHVEKMQMAG